MIKPYLICLLLCLAYSLDLSGKTYTPHYKTASTAKFAPVIIAGGVTGNISSCAGTASASPNIAQFTVSGSGLSAGITATAPAGFELSLTPGSGYGNSLTISQTGGTINNTVIYIRSAASSSPGILSGNIVLASAGATDQNIAVTGVVNAISAVKAVTNQLISNNDSSKAINFTGTANTFNWVNNTPAIGLPASGTGNIAPFAAVNTTGNPVTATVTVTPESDPLAYIPDFDYKFVSVINTKTNAVVATIPVGYGASSVAISPDGSRVYVTNSLDGTISVISTATNTVIALIKSDGFPEGIAVTPDGSRLYVASGSYELVQVISTTTYSTIATIDVGDLPKATAVSTDGKLVYVTNELSGSVSVISTATNTVIATIPVGQNPYGIALSQDGNRIYIPNLVSGTVSVINSATNGIIATIPVGVYPQGVAVSPDDSRVYVTNNTSNTLSVINAATNAVIATVNTGVAPIGVSVSPDGTHIYVANYGSQSVSVIDAATNTVTGTIKVSFYPEALGNFISKGSQCGGTPVSFTITVNALPNAISVGTATGIISACAGSVSASPDIQQFRVSGKSLTNDITATAPAGFEVSLDAGSGYGSTVMLPQTGGKVDTTTVYIRSAAADPAGTITGNVLLTSTGAPNQSVAVHGVINALPTINSVANQSVTAGDAVTAINFTGTGNTFTWTNDKAGIGLAASGTGNINKFVPVNTGNSPVTATITVTPLLAGFAYIANIGMFDSDNVLVLNTSTNKIIDTIPVGKAPYGVSVSPDGSKAYVTNEYGGNISVINTATNTVMTTIPVDGGPLAICGSLDGKRIYVACTGTNTVSVIDAVTNTVLSSIPVEPYPSNLVVSPDGSKVFVTFNAGQNFISVINTAENTISSHINIFPDLDTTPPHGDQGGSSGGNPDAIAISPDGSRLYDSSVETFGIAVINTLTDSIINVIPTPIFSGINRLSLTLDGSRLYTSNGPGSVYVIDVLNNKFITTIPVNTGGLVGISTSADGTLAYVVSHDGSVSAINLITNTVITTVPIDPTAVSTGNFIKNGSGCPGEPVTFTITINPSTPVINTTGTLASLSTIYGTASSSTSFNISATKLVAGISITAPQGFEVSSDNTNFSNSITVGAAGTVSSLPVYVRLASSASIGNYAGDIVLSAGATTVNVLMANSMVNLAANNFKLTITSATCKDSNNGSINIAAAQNLSYIATITGNGLNTPYPFTESADINSLAAGNYHICITVAGQNNYQQCFDAVIIEPQDLSVYSTINDAGKSITLALGGGTQYNINLNGVLYTTTNNEIVLKLAEGNNELSVSTDKLCQGIIQKTINLSGKITPYPVPFQNTLNLNIGTKTVKNVLVEIHSATDGKLVYSKLFGSQSGVLQLDLTNLDYGVYALHLSMDDSERIFKISKK